MSNHVKLKIHEMIPVEIDKLSGGILRKYARVVFRRLKVRDPSKLGQHFVVNPKLVRTFVETLSKHRFRKVFEIGSGHGVLTLYVSQCCDFLVGSEVDSRVLTYCKTLLDLKSIHNVDILHCDALYVDWSRFDAVISNLPFNITSEVLTKLVRERVPYALLTVQYEVANRLVATPGSDSYGRLTVLVQCFYNVRKVAKFGRSSFYPMPEVNSCVVELKLREKPLLEYKYLPALEEVTRRLFAHRNKLAHKVIREELNLPEDIVDKSKRVYELTLDDIIQLVLHFYEKISMR